MRSPAGRMPYQVRSEEHTSELQSRQYLVCRLLLEKKRTQPTTHHLESSSCLYSAPQLEPRAARRGKDRGPVTWPTARVLPSGSFIFFFFFNDTAPTEIYTLSLHDSFPIYSFRIPPFLLPIYQAAGIQYDVPWQVLAAINEIETDYGRNLSVSSAGARGRMEFLPSTWKSWGVDANGDGVADPYNPVDAIFTAARYLHAAGASQNLSSAIYAYHHANWYVQSVLLRAKLIGGIPNALIG